VAAPRYRPSGQPTRKARVYGSESARVVHDEAMTLQQTWFARDARGWTCAPPDGDAAAFHRRLPGYAATPLVEAPGLAAELGVGRLFVKDESARFDLRAFKFLGASWAGFRAVAARTGYAGPAALDGLRAHLRGRETAGDADLALVTATDGNHGRAVARTARLLGLPARVYVPKGVPDVVIDRISAEGARITVVDADYDGAVAAARSDADGAAGSAGADGSAGLVGSAGSAGSAGSVGGLLIQDTGWAGYEQIPSWIVDGYETMFAEIDAQLSAAGAAAVDLVSVQVGVGSLAQAAVAHHRSSALAASARPRLLSVEPDTAACVLRSLADGALVSVPTGATVMNGLNCGTPSSIAWPYLRGGLDAAIAVTDDEARAAIADLASAGVAAGPSGAAGLAGLRAALTGPNAAARRRDLGLGPDPGLDHRSGHDNGGGTRVAVCVCTEGPLTDAS
jgi:diaminopropionate ammonia-lyase